MLTLPELSEKLLYFEVEELIELLDVSKEDIIERFQDYIEEAYDILIDEVEELDYDE